MAGPVMRVSTSLHGDYAGSLLGHERQDFLAPELLTESHAAVGAGAARLKGSFCKVKADNANFVHGCPLPFVGCANRLLGTSRCRREGASTPSYLDRLRLRLRSQMVG